MDGSINLLPRVASSASVYDAESPHGPQPRSGSPTAYRRKASLLNKNGHASGASLTGGAGSMHSLRAAMQASDVINSAPEHSFSRTQSPSQLVAPSSIASNADARSPPPKGTAPSTGSDPQSSMTPPPALAPAMPSPAKPEPTPSFYAQAGGMSLVTFTMWQSFMDVALSVLLQYSFADALGFDLAKLVAFLDAVFWLHPTRDGFHGALKTADALHAAHIVLQQSVVHRYLQDMDLFATLLATLTMDIGHLGVTNEFLVRMGHPVTNLFGVSSPLESMSAALAVGLLRDPRLAFLSEAWLAERPAVVVFGHRPNAVILKDLLAQLIVATSPSAHLNVVTPLQSLFRSAGYNATSSPRGGNRRRSNGAFDSLNGSGVGAGDVTPTSAAEGLASGEWLAGVREADMPLVLQAIVRLADASYTLREVPVFYQWVDGLVVEYRHQHDEELRQGMSPTLSARIEPNPFEYHYRLMGMVVGPLVDALPIVPHDFRRCIKANIRSSAETTADEASDILPGMRDPMTRWEDLSRMTLSILKHSSPVAAVLLSLGGVGRRASQANLLAGTPAAAAASASDATPPTAAVAGTGARAAEALASAGGNSRSRTTQVQVHDPSSPIAASPPAPENHSADISNVGEASSTVGADGASGPKMGRRSSSFSGVSGGGSGAFGGSVDADVPASTLLAMLRLLAQHASQLACSSGAAGGGGLRAGFEPSFDAELVRLVYQLAPELLGSGGGGATRPTSNASSAGSSPAGPSLGVQPPSSLAPRSAASFSGSRDRPRTFGEYSSVAREIVRHADTAGWFASPTGAADGAAGASSAPGYLTSSASPNTCVAWVLKVWAAIRAAVAAAAAAAGGVATSPPRPPRLATAADDAASPLVATSKDPQFDGPGLGGSAATIAPLESARSQDESGASTAVLTSAAAKSETKAGPDGSFGAGRLAATAPPLYASTAPPAALPSFATSAHAPALGTPSRPVPAKYRSPYTLGRR